MKHGTPSAYNKGCHCDECRKQHRKRQAVIRARLAARPRDEVPHGMHGYRNWGCRCEVCTTANSEDCRERRGGPVPLSRYDDLERLALLGMGQGRIAHKGREFRPAEEAS
jgi:hypothetical protein